MRINKLPASMFPDINYDMLIYKFELINVYDFNLTLKNVKHAHEDKHLCLI